MNKEDLIKQLRDVYFCTPNQTYGLFGLLRNIINALPEEPVGTVTGTDIPFGGPADYVKIIEHKDGFCSHPNCYKCRSAEDAMRRQEGESDWGKVYKIAQELKRLSEVRP